MKAVRLHAFHQQPVIDEVPEPTGNHHPTVAPYGSFRAADGQIVETTPAGAQVATKTLDTTGVPPGSGTLFGLAVSPDRTGVYFVDDGTNTLNILH